MLRHFALTFILLTSLSLTFLVAPLAAQDTTTPPDAPIFNPGEGWTLEQRCVKAATTPPAGWSYDGTIFMYEYERGAKALRSDVSQPYFIAFDGETAGGNYNIAGQVSLDGKWYAVPSGRDYYEDPNTIMQTFDRIYSIDDINIFSTGAASKLMYSIPWSAASVGDENSVYPIVWKNNSTIIYPEYRPYLGASALYQVNPFNGAKALYPKNTEDNIQYSNLSGFSPDGTLAFDHTKRNSDGILMLKEVETGKIIADSIPQDIHLIWLRDSSGYFLAEKSEKTESSEEMTRINLYDREGKLLESLGEFDGTGWFGQWSFDRLNGRYLALTYSNKSTSLYIFDLEQHRVIDPCLDNTREYAYGFYWSPVTNQLLIEEATPMRKDLFHIIDWQNSEDYIIAEVPVWGTIWGWYPNEKTPPAQ